MACSSSAPRTTDELLDRLDRKPKVSGIDGVFEYTHIAFTPSLFYRHERSVSIVTRYWGNPPERLGLEIHGNDSILSTLCFGRAWPAGAVGFGRFTDGRPSFRELAYAELPMTLTPEHSEFLEARFGPPVDVPVPKTALAGAWFLLLWQPLLIVLLFVGGYALLIRRWRRRRREQAELIATIPSRLERLR
jgi:hypothetical protein